MDPRDVAVERAPRHSLAGAGLGAPVMERDTALETVKAQIHGLRELHARLVAQSTVLRGPVPQEGESNKGQPPEPTLNLVRGLGEVNVLIKLCHNELNEHYAVLGV